jgi:hypothetical protein
MSTGQHHGPNPAIHARVLNVTAEVNKPNFCKAGNPCESKAATKLLFGTFARAPLGTEEDLSAQIW